jgi:glucosamine-6-phosphate deaminase
MTLTILDAPHDVERQAARHAARVLAGAIASTGSARLVAATGSSQIGLLRHLTAAPGIDWTRVELFHLDEYIGLGADHPAGFVRFLNDRLIGPTGIRTAYLLDGLGQPDVVIRGASAAIETRPPDLLLAGVGENGHLAFNEPTADFNRPEAFFVVELDAVSRRQQVGEGWFASIDDVPRTAITMSISQILRAREIVCLVLGSRKARAVEACFAHGASPEAPASVLQTHANATIYMDADAAALLPAR